MANNTNDKHHHTGHRSRMKHRYLISGIDSMADHEILEMLLYFAIPYKDTNGLAHRLLREFGGLSNVLDADYEALKSINGIGENAATLLSFIPQLLGRYSQDKFKEMPDLTNRETMIDYVKSLFVGDSTEFFYLICLDGRGQLKNVVKLSVGVTNEVVIYISQVVETALHQKCRYTIIAHNHPSGKVAISRNDVDTTRSCSKALAMVGIKLLDHIIVCGEDYISFKEKHLMHIDAIK